MRHSFVGPVMKKLEGRIENPYTRSEVVQGHVAKLPAGHVEDADAVGLAERSERSFQHDRPAQSSNNTELGVAAEDRRYLFV
jgi:hypothetical protein